MIHSSAKISTLLLALAVGAGAALAQQIEIAPPLPATTEPAPATAPTVIENPAATPPRTGATSIPSAQSYLDDLLREKPPTPPTTAPTLTPSTTRAATSTAPALEMSEGVLREGQSLAARSGHLAKDPAGHLQFIFDIVPGKPNLPTMGIVPSRKLVALEEASDNGTKPTRFTIDAQITQYRNKNFLYLSDTDAPPPPAAAATAPATGTTMPQVAPVAPEVPTVMRLRERDSIYSRVGRLVKDEKTGIMLFAFDSDGQKMADPPMGLIPCRYLAVLEDASENGTKPLKFRISGEVTQYRGKNYLFLKFVQVVRDLNQGLGG